jgi:hypothetical protein
MRYQSAARIREIPFKARLDGMPGKPIVDWYVMEVVTSTYFTTSAVQLGLLVQDAEAPEPSEHSQPQLAEVLSPLRLAPFNKAACCMPAISVGFCTPYSAPALAAAETSIAA